MRPIDADELKESLKKLKAEGYNRKYVQGLQDAIDGYFPQIIDDEPTLCVVPTKKIYKLRDTLQKLSNDKWESFERIGCSNRYLQGKAHAYSIVVDMIDDLLEDNLGDDTNA